MVAADAAPSPGQAVAKAQALARRAGSAWNRHDAACARDLLTLAQEKGLPRLMVEYGGLRIRFDLVAGGEQVPADVVVQVAGGDESMERDSRDGRGHVLSV